jgi:hypothetical protein
MRTTLTISIAASTLVIGTSAQRTIMCKNPKTYVCNVNGCLPALGSKHNEAR